MAKDAASKPALEPTQAFKKRKVAATNSNDNSKAKDNSNKKQKTQHFNRQRDARTLATQTSSKALQNGALDVDKFVQAREFEIRALEQGIQRSGQANNRRAFQQVPTELRRRTASHNVKRVPKRLRGRASKEMVEDNTPTVNAKTRKPTRHMRLRMENVKRLRALGAKKKAERDKAEKVTLIDPNAKSAEDAVEKPSKDTLKMTTTSEMKSRIAKPKKTATLAKPPVPKAKFRKRQIHKSWLPTHLFHAKRAHMTPPSAPLWRFAIALMPTQKCYRPTHRAAWERGCVAWDMSYMGTIGLNGREASILNVLQGLGLDAEGKDGFDAKWKDAKRAREMWVYARESKKPIAPVQIIWCPPESTGETVGDDGAAAKTKRSLFIRVHPSAFFQLWEEVVRLSKVAKPAVSVEDLRFEIGSIEVAGPGATEALLGALWPSPDLTNGSVEQTWSSLAGLTYASLLPEGVQLAFNVQDPRIHHPPRTINLPQTPEEQDKLVHLAADWPLDKSQSLPPSDLFTHTPRNRNSKLSSQKAINRRKSLAAPGAYPEAVPTDPKIPVLLYTTPPKPCRSKEHPRVSSWAVLAPWKTIQAIWYSIQYYPLSTGQQPRFGGLNETRQLAFETGQPWFPADFPGTDAGWAWEILDRRRRWEEWHKRPKGKRITWEKVELGEGRKGEVGKGWACDWVSLLGGKDDAAGDEIPKDAAGDKDAGAAAKETEKAKDAEPAQPPKPTKLTQLSANTAFRLLKAPPTSPLDLEGQLITVRLITITKGVPQACARIYRLPSASKHPELQKTWLALQSTTSPHPKKPKKKQQLTVPKLPPDTPKHIAQQRLAASLLEPPRAGPEAHPDCPGVEDLIGFVTTGNFNLAEGKGTGIGSILIEKVLGGASEDDTGRLCIVRNSGESVGRLAKWDVV